MSMDTELAPTRPAATARLIIALLGAAIFLGVFALRYAMIDPHLYVVRDDGVITMSTARNLIDFGFIGVSPSGPIVEASSSPLQTLVYGLAYAITGVDYVTFSTAQTYGTAALIGAIFALFFADLPALRAGLATLGAALLLTVLYPFFLWHGSGMENALTHLFFLWSVYAVFAMGRDGRIWAGWGLVFLAASTARMDSVVQITFLLAAFSAYWLVVHRSLSACWLSVGVGVAWCLIQTVRYAYFGEIFPNTASAQEISIGVRLLGVVTGDMAIIKDVIRVWGAQVVKHGWLVVLIALPFIRLGRLTPGTRAALIVLMTLGVLSFVTPLLFGRARIDVTRTTTQLTLLAVLAATLIIARLEFWAKGQIRMRAAVTATAVAAWAAVLVFGPGPYYLGWHTSEMRDVRLRFEALGRENALPRPLVANHDLGVLSWKKSLNIIDIGRLGSPVIANLPSEERRGNYMLDFAQPDLVATQHIWTEIICDGFFRDPRFDALYMNVDAPEMTGTAYCDGDKTRAFWIRRAILPGSGTLERRLLDRLVSEGQTVAAYQSGAEADVGAVMRTAFRFLPELRAAGLADDVIALFDGPRRAYLDSWRDPDAADVLITFYR